MTVRFSPNIPQTLALQASEGELDDRYNRVHFTLVDGREMVLSSHVAAKLNGLELKPGETFGICKRWTGEQSEPVSWTVWLSPATEQARAKAEQESEEIQAKLTASIARVQEIRRPAPVPEGESLGTGTDGPAPKFAPRPVKAASVPVRVPYNVAFREVVQFVTEGLKQAGEQWNDQAKQDMVSTVLISAAKANLLSLWERS